MKLSDGEKLIILMLADMYKAQKIKGEFDPEFISHTIHRNYLWGFNWQYTGIPFADKDDVTPPEVKQTGDVLDMWFFLEESYARLSDADKARVEKEAAPFGKHVNFTGFDGNNEPHGGIASYLVEHLDRFTHFKGRNFNSHAPSIDGYMRMYKVFEPIRETIHSGSLSANQIIQILKARMHPEHRK